MFKRQNSNVAVGWQLGSDPEIQVPNLVSNHLTTGLLAYINTTGRYTSGENLFEKLRMKDPEISSLLAQVLFAGDEEVKAVRLLRDAVEEIPMDYSLLLSQASFLQGKGILEWALPLAQRAVIAAPSEFSTWAKVAEIYVAMENWDLALLTLNSCPMFTYQDKDTPRMPEPAKVNLPLLPDTMLDEIDESLNGQENEAVHPSLRKLNAANYKGTFLKAYSLLTDITSKIGWDQLLRIRSQVFVMEEEYRSERVPAAKAPGDHPDAASSTTALRAPSPEVNGDGGSETGGNDNDEATLAESKHDASDDNEKASKDSLEKPTHTVTSEEVKSGNEDVSRPRKPFHFRTNRTSSPIPHIPITPNSSTNASANAGLTTSSWFSTKISVFTPYGAPKWLAQKPATTRTLRTLQRSQEVLSTKVQKNGRSWETYQKDFTTNQRQLKHTSSV